VIGKKDDGENVVDVIAEIRTIWKSNPKINQILKFEQVKKLTRSSAMHRMYMLVANKIIYKSMLYKPL
jgi:hypothetical protein